jgi:hypothetical protein
MSKGWSIARNYFPVPWQIPWKTGRFYSFTLSGSLTSAVLGSSIIYLVPIYVPNVAGVTVTSMGLEVTSAGAAGSLARCALYEYLEDMTFGKRVIDTGSFLTDGTGYKSGSVSVAVPQGWYMAAACSNGGTVRIAGNAFVPNFLTGNSYPLDTGSTGISIRVNLSTAAVQSIIDNGYPLYLPNTAEIISITVGSSPHTLIGI